LFYEDRRIFYRHHLRPNLNWKQHAQTIAGGHEKGHRIDQLNCPTDVIMEIKELFNRSLENQQDKQVLISDILCWGLILNENGDLFVSLWSNCE